MSGKESVEQIEEEEVTDKKNGESGDIIIIDSDICIESSQVSTSTYDPSQELFSQDKGEDEDTEDGYITPRQYIKRSKCCIILNICNTYKLLVLLLDIFPPRRGCA